MVNEALASLMLLITILSALGLGVFSGYAIIVGLLRLLAQPQVASTAPVRLMPAAVNTESGD
jgi:hypothetical protein